MIIVLKHGVSKDQTEELVKQLELGRNIKVSPIFGEESTVLGLIGDTYALDIERLSVDKRIERIMRVQEPYKRVNRKFHPDNTVIDVNGVKIGGKKIAVMAGPCSVEGEDCILEISEVLKEYGADIIRGGTYKPRTSPYAFQGLGYEGLKMMKKVKNKYGIPVISEITNPATIDEFIETVDIIQVGARSMQNFELLKILGKQDKPVLLKRGFSNTIEEFLMSAEYIAAGGNENIILCERGIRTFETYTRNTLDINAVPVLKKLSHLPVVVDPSHAVGIADMVKPLALSAVAAGADGIIVEVHTNPHKALTDGKQSITPDAFKDMMSALKKVAEAVGREL